MLEILIIIIIIAVVVSKKKASEAKIHRAEKRKNEQAAIKGQRGEARVRWILSSLPAHNFIALHDLLFETDKGTTQIDHVVVSRFGIFVIETKNYKGLLVGDEDDTHLSYYLGQQKYDVYNPLKQNSSHVRALMSILNDRNDDHFIPILALSDDCDFEVYASSKIVNFSHLRDAITENRTHIFTEQQMNTIANLLRRKNVTSDSERRKHIERVKSYQ